MENISEAIKEVKHRFGLGKATNFNLIYSESKYRPIYRTPSFFLQLNNLHQHEITHRTGIKQRPSEGDGLKNSLPANQKTLIDLEKS